jgi:hypothetical protein
MNDDGVDRVRPELVSPENRTFGENNKGFYWKEGWESSQTLRDVRGYHTDDSQFIIL